MPVTTPPVTRPFTTPSGGLTEEEAAARRAAGMANRVTHHASRTYWDILRQNAYPAINGVLLSVAVLLVAWGLYVEALVTAGPVLAIIVVGVVQEGRAKRALDRIAVLTRPRATVVRGGAERVVDPDELVLGDLFVVRRGDEVVLDGVVVGGHAELDESLLTGESDPAPREVGDTVWSGSAVVSGALLVEATAVGIESLAGRIVAEARGTAADRRTPVQHEIAVMIWVVAALVALAAIPVAVRTAGGGPEEALGAAAVLVSLVPQGLAIMVTVTYAVGALRVSRMGALVQRQNAIESISRVTTLCVDKTGTLTAPRITFAGIHPVGGHPAPTPHLLGSLAASFTTPTRTTAALAAAHPASPLPVAEEVGFSSERRWCALRLTDDPGPTVHLLGAPDALLPGPLPDEVGSVLGAATARGERVLLLARAPAAATLRDRAGVVLPDEVEPVALLSFVEEVRTDAADTVAAFRAAGVEVKVISGDDPVTVAALARRVGLDPGVPRSGPALAAMDDETLGEALDGAVFGRVDPPLKARLVRALRRRGAYVAMVGDGVNDVLSLRHATLGIAMESGAAATRGVADIVLAGDRFAVLPRAVVEGRRIVSAMEVVLLLLLTRTFAMLLLLVATAALGMPVPITPRQNSILAFVAVGAPLLAAAVLVPPRRPPSSLLRRTLRISIPVGLALGVLGVAVAAVAEARGLPLVEGRTLVTTVLVTGGLGVLPLALGTGVRVRGRWALTGAMVLLYAAVLAVPPVRAFFGLESLLLDALATAVAAGAIWTAAVAVVWLLVAHAAGGDRRRRPPRDTPIRDVAPRP